MNPIISVYNWQPETKMEDYVSKEPLIFQWNSHEWFMASTNHWIKIARLEYHFYVGLKIKTNHFLLISAEFEFVFQFFVILIY